MTAAEEPRDRTFEEAHRVLRRALDHLEIDLDDVFDGTAATDPDGFFARFDADRESLDHALERVLGTLQRLRSVEPFDLNRVAARTLENALITIEKPLQLSVHWAEDLPKITVCGEPLRCLLERLIRLVLRVAESGERVVLRTESHGGAVQFTVAVDCDEPRRVGQGRQELTARAHTLTEFAADLGARLAFQEAGLGVRLTFPARIAVR